MVNAAEREGLLRPGSVLVESSSGNLGVALSVIAASRGYRFLCVTDARCNRPTIRLMEALGTQVHVIEEPDLHGGFLGARIAYVRALCASDDRYVWLNQYSNQGNWRAHYRTTAPGDRPPLPGPGRPVRRGRHHRDADGLRPLVLAVAAPGADRRRRHRRLGQLRRDAGPPDDPGARHERAAAAARRVVRGRRGPRRGDRRHPRLPPAGRPGFPVRRLDGHGGQRRRPVAGRSTAARASRRWPSPRTSANAIWTPSTARAGRPTRSRRRWRRLPWLAWPDTRDQGARPLGPSRPVCRVPGVTGAPPRGTFAAWRAAPTP